MLYAVLFTLTFILLPCNEKNMQTLSEFKDRSHAF